MMLCRDTLNANENLDLMDDVSEPLFSEISSLHQRGLVVAQQMYGVNGSVGHHNTDLWGDAAPQDTGPPRLGGPKACYGW